jgi:hypothetical protein
MFTQSLIYELTGVLLPAIIYEYNIGAIYLVKDQQVSCRTKHIDIHHHYLRDLKEAERLEVRFKRSEDNSSDIMTKNTPRDIHFWHTKSIPSGILTCWREDVKSDPSVTLPGGRIPVKSTHSSPCLIWDCHDGNQLEHQDQLAWIICINYWISVSIIR